MSVLCASSLGLPSPAPAGERAARGSVRAELRESGCAENPEPELTRIRSQGENKHVNILSSARPKQRKTITQSFESDYLFSVYHAWPFSIGFEVLHGPHWGAEWRRSESLMLWAGRPLSQWLHISAHCNSSSKQKDFESSAGFGFRPRSENSERCNISRRGSSNQSRAARHFSRPVTLKRGARLKEELLGHDRQKKPPTRPSTPHLALIKPSRDM